VSDPVEIVGALFGVLAVWLTVRQNIWCWPTGLVNVGLFIVVFWRARLYADMGLQVIYVALCLYGWWAWRHGGGEHGALEVSRAPRRLLAVGAVAGAAFALALGRWLGHNTDAALPFWDAGTAAFSLVAQWLQTRKWLENWLVWIAVDLVYVGIYLAKALYPTALLYAVFLGLAVRGLVAWRRSLAAAAGAAPGGAAPATAT
jgi:nicotinamide mononucleotide transporter